ncbi:MAG TPA: cyclic nucleotide-binding domain-containing protein [Elusimicrobiota bacterium]|nr:cyclic nucleotide-binding domain-containing protein [Elusimicrobiota bacterium]
MPFDDTVFLKSKVDVLSFFTDEQLRRVTSVIDRKTYNKGQTVMFQGEVTNNFFVVKKGKVMVVAKVGKEKERVELAELKAGDFFGEMSLLESTAATATIKSVEEGTEILMIPHDSFQYLLKENPLLEKTLRDRIAARKQQKSDASPKEGA